VPKFPYADETDEYQNAELSSQLRSIKQIMIGTHAFCTAASLIAKVWPNENSSGRVMLKSGLIILAMGLQVFNVTKICGFIFSENSITAGVEMSNEFTTFNIWVQIEVAIFAFCLLANMTFLFIRSCVHHKILFHNPRDFSIRTDYL
jgi:hypothetical protein